MQIALKNTDFMQAAISRLKEPIKESTLDEIGKITGDAMGTFAPQKTGALRKDFRIDHYKNAVAVVWGYHGAPTEDYAHYQYEGVVYGPNFADFSKHGLWTDEFKSPPHKVRTDRMMGDKRTIVLKNGRVIFIHGYSTPNTGPRWIERARNTPTVYYPMRRAIYEILADAVGEKITGKRYYNG